MYNSISFFSEDIDFSLEKEKRTQRMDIKYCRIKQRNVIQYKLYIL